LAECTGRVPNETAKTTQIAWLSAHFPSLSPSIWAHSLSGGAKCVSNSNGMSKSSGS